MSSYFSLPTVDNYYYFAPSPGQSKRLKDIIIAFSQLVKISEPGMVRFQFFELPDKSMIVHKSFKDRRSAASHEFTEYYQKLQSALAEQQLLEGNVVELPLAAFAGFDRLEGIEGTDELETNKNVILEKFLASITAPESEDVVQDKLVENAKENGPPDGSKKADEGKATKKSPMGKSWNSIRRKFGSAKSGESSSNKSAV